LLDGETAVAAEGARGACLFLLHPRLPLSVQHRRPPLALVPPVRHAPPPRRSARGSCSNSNCMAGPSIHASRLLIPTAGALCHAALARIITAPLSARPHRRRDPRRY